jgi:polysaccharide pyruvyl transferase WcaK-like protein
MQTILLSTSSLWNCGDDFIREGLLELLGLRANVRVLWWNRGHGISSRFANALKTNLPLIDYFIMAGTPEWVYKNENIYEYCLKHSIPLSIIGVGTIGLFCNRHYKLMKQVARSGLCELALARDEAALNSLRGLGFANAELMLDPAFFVKPLPIAGKVSIIGWRHQFGNNSNPEILYSHPHKFLRIKQIEWATRAKRRQMRDEYDRYMKSEFVSKQKPKQVVVHDNREIEEAENVFGREHVFYSSDYRDIFKCYASAKSYTGSRLHGAIPALIHGASVNLIYSDGRRAALETAKSILSQHIDTIDEHIHITVCGKNDISPIDRMLKPIGKENMRLAITKEKEKIRSRLKSQKSLSRFMI